MKQYKILVLFSDLLDFDGTRGDVMYMTHRLTLYGINFICHYHLVGEVVDVRAYDFVYAGVCPKKYEKLYLRQLSQSVIGLKEYITSDKPFLAIEQSFLFLGRSVNTSDEDVAFLDILPFKVTKRQNYTMGNILLHTTLAHDFVSEMNGFYNSEYDIELDANVQPFGNILLGQDFLWDRGYEGMAYHQFIGTQLRGPILARNYDFCDWLIQQMVIEPLGDIDSNLDKTAKAILTKECYAFIESEEQKKTYTYIS